MILASCFTYLCISSAVLSTSLAVPHGHPPPPYNNASRVVHLPGYGSFQGTQINMTLTNDTLPQPVDAWLGIDYATQPVGPNRFAPVSWPAPFEGIKDATTYGPICTQNASSVTYPQSEACLNFNVYRTANIPVHQKLPVFIWIHGGSFVSGNGRSLDGAAFVAYSKVPIVVVTFQYRLNSLGSLPSTLFQEEGLLNLGLRDQRLFLEGASRYAEYFGGCPDAITLGGQSAGAHSVGIQYFHNYGETTGRPLFNQAIMSSGTVTARSFPNATYPLYEMQFAEYMSYLGCPTDDNAAALACLRTVDISQIQYISSKMYADSEYNITWPFQPVRGGPLLEIAGSISGEEGTFFHLPLLISSNTDEGKAFAPGNLNTSADFINFMHNISPGMTDQDLKDLNALYPDPIEYPTSPYANSPNSTEYNRISAAYGDYSYICPVQENAYRSSIAGVPVWKARFNTPDDAPAWRGVAHASDSRYLNGLPNAQFPDVSNLYHGYYVSFITTGNPNTVAIAGAPTWEPYYDFSGIGAAPGERMQLVVSPNNATMMEKDEIRAVQCLWWRDPARMLRLNK